MPRGLWISPRCSCGGGESSLSLSALPMTLVLPLSVDSGGNRMGSVAVSVSADGAAGCEAAAACGGDSCGSSCGAPFAA